jgi:pimeloyl-ACP methyl ester carboxylesterase
MNKKLIYRSIKVFLLLYCIIGIVFYYNQERLLFHPVPASQGTAYQFAQPFTELNLPYDKDTRLNVIELKATDRSKDSLAKGVILYFHGNAENNSQSVARQAGLTARGYEVWMMDYPGYGKSTGPFSEKKLYDYALVFYKLARSRWKPSQIVLYGRSLGTGIAAQLASVRDSRRLILESPYYSMTSLFRRYLFIYPVGTLLHYHFPTNEYLPDVTAPVTIFHGSADGTIPYTNALRLKPLLKAGDEFITIPGGGHNDLHESPLFRSKIDSVLGL